MLFLKVDHCINKVLPLEEEALTLSQKIFGEENELTATSFNNVGTTYGELGDYQKALEHHLKLIIKLGFEIQPKN